MLEKDVMVIPSLPSHLVIHFRCPLSFSTGSWWSYSAVTALHTLYCPVLPFSALYLIVNITQHSTPQRFATKKYCKQSLFHLFLDKVLSFLYQLFMNFPTFSSVDALFFVFLHLRSSDKWPKYGPYDALHCVALKCTGAFCTYLHTYHTKQTVLCSSLYCTSL